MTDAAAAEHADPERSSRRALLGAGVVGAMLAAAGARTAGAQTGGLAPADRDLFRFAIGLELAARDLYDAAIAAGADGAVWSTMREHHESYAQLLAGIAGLSAGQRDDAVFDQYADAFGDSSPLAAARELENIAAATHVDLTGQVDDVGAAGAVASIAVIASRHATVLALVEGTDDLDALFLNTATPLSPEA